MANTLIGKIALVTAGSRGIGAAVVRRLASDGATVAFTYAASEDRAKALVAEIENAGGTALAIQADSGDAEAVKGAVAQTVDRFGRLDILVNNAGILIGGIVDDFALSDFDRMVAVNVRAVFVAIQAVVPHMGQGGRIITTGSVTADRSGFPGASVYSMTKGAVAAMTRGLGPRGITVNAIQPGPTETDMNSSEAIRSRLRPPDDPWGLGRDSEVASLIAYLASPESGFITGAALTVDGGYLA
jgi:3-oxoacyl-[acyl-carrier protein] reductase